uniref:Hypothetical conserved protein n=1 Tax=uncultured Chloroflexota bacterium TaxID=166587 RepID=H5SPG4_9CHLR|nr:hypothetical conserved protein [uncultured Chloroflexota bacterium]BAL58050.1 hypothetical conserved protein [uncultured Chloroflexota bacterium]
MHFSGQRVLFIGAHPDDIELGCGALIHHIARSRKSEILCVTLSDNQKNPALKNLIQEMYASMEVLGVPPERILLGKFTTRHFHETRQELLDYLVHLRRDFQPEIVFVHSRQDIHQDHNIVTEEALRAFRGTTLFGFEIIRSSYGFFPQIFLEVDEEDVQAKVEALACYETYAEKNYFDPEVIRATLKRNGAISERAYAEGFDLLRLIGRFAADAAEK